MNMVGQIDGCGTFGKLDGIAFGCIDDDGIPEDIAFDGIQEFARIIIMTFVPQGLELLDDGDFSWMNLVGAFAFFIRPMGGDAELGGFVHGFRSDLDFQGPAASVSTDV
jgi:hypothetical protein